MQRWRSVAGRRRVALFAVVAALVVAGCSSGDDSGGSAATTTEATGSGGGGPSTSAELPPGSTSGSDSGQGIEGVWTADASDLLTAGTGGGNNAVSCYGVVTLTFRADGTFAQRGTVPCELRDLDGILLVEVAGEYGLDGDTITVSNVQGRGYELQIGSTTGPLEIGVDLADATYSVSGDTLLVTSGTTSSITQSYTRSR